MFDLEWEHIRFGQAWVAQNITISHEIAKLCSEYTNQTNCVDLRLHPRVLISWHEASLSADQFLGDRKSEGVDLGNLGNAYADLGDARKAIEFHEQALIIDREIGDRRGEGAALGNLGNAYAALGDVRKAIEFHEQRMVIAREIGDRRGEGNALFNVGLSLYDLDEKEKGINLVKQALKIYEAIESPSAKNARNKLKEWGALE